MVASTNLSIATPCISDGSVGQVRVVRKTPPNKLTVSEDKSAPITTPICTRVHKPHQMLGAMDLRPRVLQWTKVLAEPGLGPYLCIFVVFGRGNRNG